MYESAVYVGFHATMQLHEVPYVFVLALFKVEI